MQARGLRGGLHLQHPRAVGDDCQEQPVDVATQLSVLLCQTLVAVLQLC